MKDDNLIMRRVFLIFLFIVCQFAACGKAYAGENESFPDPCRGASELLAIVDRPSVSDSPCVVPLGQAVVEMGIQYINLKGPGGGTAYNYPQAEVRVGLPGENEFVLLPPNYNRQRTDAFSDSPSREIAGFSAVTVGLKHGLGHTGHWVGSVEALFTLPSGGSAFGSRGFGAAFNGIAAYSLSEQIGLSFQLGLSSQTDPDLAGGRRFTSVISNIVVTWQPMERLQFLAETFGQSSTGPGEGAGYNLDGGVQYLITRSWVVDVEEGVRLAGDLGGFTHYLGAGMGFRF